MKHLTRSLGLAAVIALPAIGQEAVTPDGSTDDGSFIERKLESLLSGAGRQVIVTGFRGALSSRASLERMTIADEDGVWLTLIDAELDWNRSALLGGRLEVESLTAEQILVPRLPKSGNKVDLPKAEATPFKLPDLPVSVEVGELSIATVSLGAELLGEDIALSVEGSASLAGGEGQASLAIERIDDTEGTLTLSGSFENATDALTLDLELTEPANGVAVRLLDLPGRPSIDLSVDGSGALSDFTADITLATGGEERLAGQVRLTEAEGDRRFEAELGGDLAPVFSPQFEPFFGPDIRLRTSGTQFADGSLRLDTLDLTARALQLSGELALSTDKTPVLIDIEGRIVDPAGERVLLPVGSGLTVDDLGLDIAFDATRGPDWRADITLNGLQTSDATVDRLALEGIGQIVTGPAGTDAVTAALTFTAEDIALDDPGAQQALGDRVEGRADIDWSKGAPVVLQALTLTGASFELDGAGQLDSTDTGPVAGFEGAVSAGDLAAFSTLAGRSLGGAVELAADLRFGLTSRAFNVSVTGQAEDLAIDQRQFDRAFAGSTELKIDAMRDGTGTRVDTLSLTNAAAELSGRAAFTSAASSAELTLTLADAARVEPKISGPVRLSVTASGVPGAWEIDTEAEALGAGLTFAGLVDDLAKVPEMSGRLTLAGLDLARAAPLFDRPLAGVVDADISGATVLDLATFEVAGSVTGQGLATGIAELDAALLGRAGIDISASRSLADAPIAVDRLTLTSDTVELDASGRFDPGRSVAKLAAQIPDLTPFGHGLTGPARLKADAVESDGGWSLDTALRIFGADIAYIGRIEDLQTEAPRISGSAEIDGFDLGRIAQLTGRPLAGLVSARVTGAARADLSEFQVDAKATATDVRTGIAEADAALKGTATLALSARKDDADALVQLDHFDFASATLMAEGSGRYAEGASQVTLNARAPDLTPFGRGLSGPARLQASGSEDSQGWALTAEAAALGATFDFDGRIDDLRAAAPLISGRARLDALDLARLRGIVEQPLSGTLAADLSGKFRADQSAFDVTGAVTGQGLAIGNPQVDPLLAGASSLNLEASKPGANQPIRLARLDLETRAVRLSASGSYGAGQSAVTLTGWLDDMGRFAPGFSGPVNTTGRVGEAPGGVSVDLATTGPGGLVVNVSGTAATTFKQVNLAIDGSAPLALANPLLSPQSLAGTANFALRLDGAPGLPALSGTVSTAAARAVLPGPGIVMNDINATVRLDGATARINATSTKRAGGQLSVSGTLGLTGAQPVDLTVALADLVVEDPALYRTTLNGQLTLSGAIRTGARAAGTINLGTTEIRVPSSGLGTAGPIPDLIHRNEPAAVRATRARAGLLGDGNGGTGTGGGGAPAVALDVVINAENQIFVRGRGLDAELGGQLAISGSTKNVIPSGQFQLIRGRVDLLGQRLILTDGSIVLQGDFEPYLRLVAQTEANGTQLFLTLEGPLKSPEISFSSQPELPEDEVLAQLLFGKSLSDISPLQAARLALAVRTLAGKGGEGVVGRLRSEFGLDDLDVTTDDEGNAALRAGAYLSENVYSDVTVSATGDAEVNLNLDLTPSLTARGTVNNDGETSLGLFYERDY